MAGFTCKEIRDAGYSLAEAKNNFSLKEIKEAGYSRGLKVMRTSLPGGGAKLRTLQPLGGGSGPP